MSTTPPPLEGRVVGEISGCHLNLVQDLTQQDAEPMLNQVQHKV
jgi:hypothetical protein